MAGVIDRRCLRTAIADERTVSERAEFTDRSASVREDRGSSIRLKQLNQAGLLGLRARIGEDLGDRGDRGLGHIRQLFPGFGAMGRRADRSAGPSISCRSGSQRRLAWRCRGHLLRGGACSEVIHGRCPSRTPGAARRPRGRVEVHGRREVGQGLGLKPFCSHQMPRSAWTLASSRLALSSDRVGGVDAGPSTLQAFDGLLEFSLRSSASLARRPL